MTDDAIEPLVTECPNCGTRFRVTESQLEMASGKVRCGACLEVFLGIEHLVLGDDAGVLDEDVNDALDALLSELGGASNASESQQPSDTVSRATPSGDPRHALSLEDLQAQEDPDAGEDVDDFEFLASDEAAGAEVPDAADPLPTFDVEELDDDLEEFEVLEQLGGDSMAADAAPEDDEPAAASVDLDVPLEFKLHDDEEERALTEDAADDAAVEAEPWESQIAAGMADVEEILLDEGNAPNAFGWPGFKPSGEAPQRPVAKASETQVPEALASIGPLDIVMESEAPAADPRLPRRAWVPIAVAVASLALIVQVFWFQRDVWVKDLALRPIYEFACAHLGCRIEPLRAVDEIYSKNLVVRTHPDVDQALIIDALVVNGAGFPQPYPVIELRFSSIEGRTVAGRRFQPGEYLAGEAAGAELIAPNTPVHIALAIEDPGPDAVNYVMLFH